MEFSKSIIDVLKILCKTLNKANILYAITGGLAVGMLIKPRATEDIDILILIEEKDRNKILNLLGKKLNIISARKDIMRFKNFSVWRILISVKNKNVIITDFIFADNEIHKNAIQRRFLLKLKGTDIYLITIEDLILLKLLSTRPIDKLDVKNILDEKKNEIDKKYLRKWMKKYNLKFIHKTG